MNSKTSGLVAAAFVSLLGVCGTGPLAAEGTIPVPAACDSALAAAAASNGLELFQGVAACAEEGRKEDANVLIIVGQIRAMADLTILQALDEESSAKASHLYGQLYYYFGGLGFD